MADKVDVPGRAPGATGEQAGGEGPHQFGLPAAMALIIGSIIGVGIFNLPTSLAFSGPITLVSMALTTVGALVLAVLFASLSRRLPADGGPYAYARVAFGNGYGFANAWSYWITAWAGKRCDRGRLGAGAKAPVLAVAIAAAAVVLVTFVFTTLIHEPASIAALVVIVGLGIGLDLGWKRARDRWGSPVQVSG